MDNSINNTDRIKLVVIDEHTLGYINPERPDYAGVLHTSILRGSPFSYWASCIYIKNSKVRLASLKDFDDYRVSMVGYKKEEYEFAV